MNSEGKGFSIPFWFKAAKSAVTPVTKNCKPTGDDTGMGKSSVLLKTDFLRKNSKVGCDCLLFTPKYCFENHFKNVLIFFEKQHFCGRGRGWSWIRIQVDWRQWCVDSFCVLLSPEHRTSNPDWTERG